MTEQQPIAVLGGGSFGTAIANLLAENGQAVRQWMRDPEQAEAIRTRRENPRYLKGVKVHPGVEPVTDLERTLADCQLIFVALPSSALRKVLQPHQAALTDKLLVSLTKGIEAHTFKLMSEILEEIAPQARIGVISGPNLAREIAEHELTATVVASEDDELCARVQAALHGRTFRVYASRDRFGVELGGALKNVYAIMAGLAAAMDMGENTRSMLITRALAEMTRFAVKLGANPMTFLGLAGVGDLIVTCSSPKSRNYQVGHALGEPGARRRAEVVKLWLLRHGEAEPHASRDSERRLTAHGRKEVLQSAARLAGLPLDGILASPYVRAQQTAELVREALGLVEPVGTAPWLTPDDDPREVLGFLDERSERNLLLVSHQPLVGALGGLLVHGNRRDPLPMSTASLAELEGDFAAAGLMTLVSLHHPRHG